MAKQSKKLTKCYKAYWKWLKKGAKTDKPFSRSVGLCCNFEGYATDRWNAEVADNITIELRNQFLRDSLDTDYPFGKNNYQVRERANTLHKCKKRKLWVKGHRHG